MRLFSKASIPFIILIVTWVASNTQWGKNYWRDIIEADAKGNYAYLPAIFIYHDLNFGFHDSIEKKYYSPNTYYEYRTGHNEKLINKYYAGTAISELPFFMCAHIVTKITGGLTDGYSKLYPIFINIGAIFYLFLGLIYLRNLLRAFQTNDDLIAFILIAIVFGTNLFYYTVCEPGMSHIYSFAFINMFVYRGRKYFITHHKKEIIYCALLVGIIILIRPLNGIVLLALPFIAGSKQNLIAGIKGLKTQKSFFILSLFLALGIISTQFILYKIQCGDFFVYSYGEEHFNWLNPQFINFLFSYKKGFFIYTPLAFISLGGFVYLWKGNRFSFYTLLGFFFLLIYAQSSWWNWWYGGSFSSRVMVEYYVFFALLLAFIYKMSSKRKISIRSLTITVIVLIIFCQIQTYEYRYYLIHWENMNKEKYWDTFLKLP